MCELLVFEWFGSRIVIAQYIHGIWGLLNDYKLSEAVGNWVGRVSNWVIDWVEWVTEW